LVQPVARHADKVLRLFSKLFVRTKNLDKVSSPEIFPNLRLHYFDVRDYFKDAIEKDFPFINNILAKVPDAKLSDQDKVDIKLKLQDAVVTLKQVINILKYPVKPAIYKTPIVNEVLNTWDTLATENVNRLAYKMRYSYRNAEQTNTIRTVLVRTFDAVITKLDDYANQINDIVENIGNMLDEKIVDEFRAVSWSIFSAGVSLVDVFFLRRFLDKTYVTNGIVYGGGYHMISYAFILIKYFNFKITHVAHNRKHYSMKKLNEFIKSSKKIPDIQDLFYYDNVTYAEEPQCSVLDSFPKNFL
jgi:hypothetical protein